MRGLLIKSPWIEKILDGEKTWEIRGSNTTVRGRIALIRVGSGRIVGTANLVDVVGPLSREDLAASYEKHRIPADTIDDRIRRYKRVYAWVVVDVQTLASPVPYSHPSGAVIWVTLPDDCLGGTTGGGRAGGERKGHVAPPCDSRGIGEASGSPARMTDDVFARSFYFVRDHGEKWYPFRGARDSCFRVLARRSNRLADAPRPQPDNERLLQEYVLNRGLRVRCRPKTQRVKPVGLSIGGDAQLVVLENLLT
jgi:hypothetical protein